MKYNVTDFIDAIEKTKDINLLRTLLIEAAENAAICDERIIPSIVDLNLTTNNIFEDDED